MPPLLSAKLSTLMRENWPVRIWAGEGAWHGAMHRRVVKSIHEENERMFSNPPPNLAERFKQTDSGLEGADAAHTISLGECGMG
jgi:hypothetical protein